MSQTASTLHLKTVPPVRAEYERELAPLTHIQPAKALPWHARLLAKQGWRQGLILVVLALVWEAAARYQDNDLLLPTFTATLQALIEIGRAHV